MSNQTPESPSMLHSQNGHPATRLNRRSLLQIGCGAALAGIWPVSSSNVAHARANYADLVTDRYLGAAEIVATVRHEKIFTEGPVADLHGDVLFTNVPAQQILKYSIAEKTLTIVRENSNFANGLAFDPAGHLLACEGGTLDKGRVTRWNQATGETATLADSYQGKPLGAPNDLCLDSRRRIYFTSRSVDAEAANVNSVYRIDTDGKLSRILAAPDIDMPNGIEVSADDKLLYLVESDGRADRSRSIRQYDLQPDGTVRNGRVLINFYPGRSGDGLCLDADGNLYVAAGLHKTRGSSETLDTKPGIHVITPEGKLVGFVPTPEDTITNCAFGGPDLKTLYVTCGKYLLQIPAKIPGMARRKP